MALVDLLSSAQRGLQPPFAVLSDYIAGAFLTSRVVYVIAELGIADLLESGPRPLTELSSAAGCQPESLGRLLRAAASLGIFEEAPAGTWRTNALGHGLSSDAPNSMRAWARYVGAPWHQRLWAELPRAVKSGTDLYTLEHGKRFFDHFAEAPDEAAVFDEGMTGLSALSDDPVAAAWNFGAVDWVVDVAGGLGGQLAAILSRHPKVRGVLIDQGPVIQRARHLWSAQRAELLPRAELTTGNFFERLPEGADAYLFKSIIHDWSDDEAVTILSHCRAAMGPGSKVLLAELVLPPGQGPHFGKLLDVAMLALTGGKERTSAEYAALFQRAGLKLERVIPTASPYSLVVGAPQ
jgi:hypothetical protein